MMESAFFQDGPTVKSEPFCLNQESFSMSSMMPTTMAALQLQSPQMEKGSFPEVLRDKSESGKSPSKLKLWKSLLRNTAAEFGPFRSVKTTLKLSQQVVTDLASYGTSESTPDSFACSKLLPSSKLS